MLLNHCRSFIVVLLLCVSSPFINANKSFYPSIVETKQFLHKDSISSNAGLDRKQRGVHFFSNWFPAKQEFEVLKKKHVEWVVHVPTVWVAGIQSTQIEHTETQWRSELAVKNLVDQCHNHGLNVFLKPHIRLRKSTAGEWRGTIQFDNEADWQAWEQSYRNFILYYAKLSASLGIEALSIGTELYEFSRQRPQFWRALIKEVRQIYSGLVTYAANWDREFESVEFWDALDFIGVQAYFPIVQHKNPSISELKAGWLPIVERLEKLSTQHGKSLVFTEIGYKSTDDAAIKPWIWPQAVSLEYTKVSATTQYRCYEAFFEIFWKKTWFSGVHFWHWPALAQRLPAGESISFSPRNKKAETVISEWFAKNDVEWK